jgi:hypothetical protein
VETSHPQSSVLKFARGPPSDESVSTASDCSVTADHSPDSQMSQSRMRFAWLHILRSISQIDPLLTSAAYGHPPPHAPTAEHAAHSSKETASLLFHSANSGSPITDG